MCLALRKHALEKAASWRCAYTIYDLQILCKSWAVSSSPKTTRLIGINRSVLALKRKHPQALGLLAKLIILACLLLSLILVYQIQEYSPRPTMLGPLDFEEGSSRNGSMDATGVGMPNDGARPREEIRGARYAIGHKLLMSSDGGPDIKGATDVSING